MIFFFCNEIVPPFIYYTKSIFYFCEFFSPRKGVKYYAILTFQTKIDSARTYYYEKTSFSYDVVLLVILCF